MSLYKLTCILEKKELWRFWKNPYTFWKKNNYFSKKQNSKPFAEIFSKNIIWDGFYIKLAKKMHFQKKVKLLQKNHLFFKQKPKFETFENFKTKIPSSETHSLNFLPKVVIFKKFRLFFEITHLFSRKLSFLIFWVSLSTNTISNAS